MSYSYVNGLNTIIFEFVIISVCFPTVTRTLAVGQVNMIEAETGSNVTLNCSNSEFSQGVFFWYKLQFGYMIQKVAYGNLAKLTLEKTFEHQRFNITQVGDVYSLSIRNVSKDDEATYFCQAGVSYAVTFTNASQLVVKGKVFVCLQFQCKN